MGSTNAQEYLVAANRFLYEAKEKINNIRSDENSAIQSLQSLCTCFEYLGKANSKDSSAQVEDITIMNTISDGLMAMAMTHHLGFNNPIAGIACLEAAVAVHNKAVYHFMAGQLYYQIDIKKSAYEHFKSAVELDPQDEDYISTYNQIKQEIE